MSVCLCPSLIVICYICLLLAINLPYLDRLLDNGDDVHQSLDGDTSKLWASNWVNHFSLAAGLMSQN